MAGGDSVGKGPRGRGGVLLLGIWHYRHLQLPSLDVYRDLHTDSAKLRNGGCGKVVFTFMSSLEMG